MKLEIFDMYGNVVRSFETTATGGRTANVEWNGTNSNGVDVPAGVYVYKLTGNGFTLSRKMTITR